MHALTRSALGVVMVGVVGGGVVSYLGAKGRMADEAVRPVYVVTTDLRSIDVEEADRALVGVAWRRPNPRWVFDAEASRGSFDQTRVMRARVGPLTFETIAVALRGSTLDRPDRWSEGVSTYHHWNKSCASDRYRIPQHSQETLLEFRHTPDLRVTQFRCRAVYWGAEHRDPWIDSRMSFEQVVVREQVGPSDAASETARGYRLRLRWLLAALGLISAFLAGVEVVLHRPRRRSPLPPPPVYRAHAAEPERAGRPWRSNALVRARWWLWGGAVVASIYWAHEFPVELTHPSSAAPFTPPPAMVAIPAAL